MFTSTFFSSPVPISSPTWLVSSQVVGLKRSLFCHKDTEPWRIQTIPMSKETKTIVIENVVSPEETVTFQVLFRDFFYHPLDHIIFEQESGQSVVAVCVPDQADSFDYEICFSKGNPLFANHRMFRMNGKACMRHHTSAMMNDFCKPPCTSFFPPNGDFEGKFSHHPGFYQGHQILTLFLILDLHESGFSILNGVGLEDLKEDMRKDLPQLEQLALKWADADEGDCPRNKFFKERSEMLMSRLLFLEYCDDAKTLTSTKCRHWLDRFMECQDDYRAAGDVCLFECDL